MQNYYNNFMHIFILYNFRVAMVSDFNDMLWNFNAELWDFYVMLWEIKTKGLIIWQGMLLYAFRNEKKRLLYRRVQYISK